MPINFQIYLLSGSRDFASDWFFCPDKYSKGSIHILIGQEVDGSYLSIEKNYYTYIRAETRNVYFEIYNRKEHYQS